MKKLCKLILGFVLISTIANKGYATLISKDWQTQGDGLLTLDTDTNKEWLDLTQTTGQTISSITPLLQTGQLYEGFIVAQKSDVLILITNQGLPIGFSTDPSVINTSLAVTALLGDTHEPVFGSNYNGTRGFARDGGSLSSFTGIEVNHSFNRYGVEQGGAGSHASFGVWLSRDAIPEPPVDASIRTAVEVEWASVSGLTYQVQYSTNLVSTNWFDFGDSVIGNGTTNSVFDSARNNTERFYRVITE